MVGSSSYRVSGFRVRTGVVELAGRDVWGCSPTPTPAGREVKTRVPPWERSRQGGTEGMESAQPEAEVPREDTVEE